MSEAGNNSARSLGVLHMDAKAPGRWVLKVENPGTGEPNPLRICHGPSLRLGGKQPSGQKMLYAYLGAANHP